MDGLNLVDVDVESGKWRVESGAVPDLTILLKINLSLFRHLVVVLLPVSYR